MTNSPPQAGKGGQARNRPELLGQQIAVTTHHQFGSLGDQPPCAVFEELARSLPFLGYLFLTEDGGGDLTIGLAIKAFIERDQRVMEAFIDRRCRPAGSGRGLFRKAMKALEQFGLGVQVREPGDLEYGRKGRCQDRDAVDFDGNMGSWSLYQHQRNVVDTDRRTTIDIETGQFERCESFTVCRGRSPNPDHLFQCGHMPEYRGLAGRDRGIGEGIKSPSFGAGKAPPQPQQMGAVFQGNMRQAPGYGATPVRAVVRISAQKFPSPIASIAGRGATGNSCVARKAARWFGKVTVQKKPRAFGQAIKRALIVKTKCGERTAPALIARGPDLP
jgi:hypothetical protein